MRKFPWVTHPLYNITYIGTSRYLFEIEPRCSQVPFSMKNNQVGDLPQAINQSICFESRYSNYSWIIYCFGLNLWHQKSKLHNDCWGLLSPLTFLISQLTWQFRQYWMKKFGLPLTTHLSNQVSIQICRIRGPYYHSTTTHP